jgi:hypothetical protein
MAIGVDLGQNAGKTAIDEINSTTVPALQNLAHDLLDRLDGMSLNLEGDPPRLVFHIPPRAEPQEVLK